SVREGKTAVYDADLQAYFDSIPHDKLLACVATRIADRSVLRLIRQWLTAPVEERDEHGRPTRCWRISISIGWMCCFTGRADQPPEPRPNWCAMRMTSYSRRRTSGLPLRP